MTKKTLPILLIALICTLIGAPQLYAQENQQKLEALRQQITALKNRLNKDESSLQQQHKELQKIDTDRAQMATRLQEYQKSKTSEQTKLAHLQTEFRHQQQLLEKQKTILEAQLISAWTSGRQESLKILLGQNNPATISRTMTYYRYISRRRAEVIEETRTHIRQLATLEAAIIEKQNRLAALTEQTEQALAALQKNRQQRNQLVTQIRQRINQQQSQLHNLQEDEKRIEGLLKELDQLLADIPDDAGDAPPFATLRGKLPWPATGTVSRNTNTNSTHKAGSGFNGILIAGKEGSPIRSIAAGRVVFADWFRGLGLLVIIDHGDNFMSLYGHNQTLLVGIGQWISPGEVIATLGDSGGSDKTALYFEIRASGRPQNPIQWCAKRTTTK